VEALPDEEKLRRWKKASVLDTKGVVAIMCGETLEEIEVYW
jgi:hypothetical protein